MSNPLSILTLGTQHAQDELSSAEEGQGATLESPGSVGREVSTPESYILPNESMLDFRSRMGHLHAWRKGPGRQWENSRR